MRHARSRPRRFAAILAVAALPCLALAPAFSGVHLLHDHGRGVHHHRLDTAPHHHPGHGPAAHAGPHHDHRHPHGGEVHPSAQAPDAPPDNHAPGVVIVVPDILVARVSSPLHHPGPIAEARAEPAAMAPVSGGLDRPPAHPFKEGRAPPRGRLHGVLVTTHALLI